MNGEAAPTRARIATTGDADGVRDRDAQTSFVLEFRVSTREQAVAAASTLLLIPALGERSLQSAELAWPPGGRALSALLRFERERFGARARARVAFWCARAGGSLRPDRGAARDPARAVAVGLDAESWAAAVARAFAAIGHDGVVSAPIAPLLRIHPRGPATAGLEYDPARRRVFVACPTAPPVGDALVLEVVGTGGERLRGFARVEEVRPRDAAAPGRPAGFSLRVESESVAAALAAMEVGFGGAEQRLAPRMRVAAPVAVEREANAAGPAEAGRSGRLCDLSHRGAFIRLADPPPVGSRVRLALRLPATELVAVATVVRTTPEGVGVRFRLDDAGEELLAEALTCLAGRSHRVLMVEDDAFAARLLADGFEGAGFEVVRASSGDDGLRALADEILTLDAVVTDLVMPGLTGEELVRMIRGPGGECDLPIVVATANHDEATAARLRAAGADRVVPKSSGVASIVDATIEAISARGGSEEWEVSVTIAERRAANAAREG